MYRERGRDFFQELAPAIVNVGKSQICRVKQQAGDPGRRSGSSPKALGQQNPSSSWNISLFLFRTPVDSVSPTHIIGSNLLYSKFTDLNVNLI